MKESYFSGLLCVNPLISRQLLKMYIGTRPNRYLVDCDLSTGKQLSVVDKNRFFVLFSAETERDLKTWQRRLVQLKLYGQNLARLRITLYQGK